MSTFNTKQDENFGSLRRVLLVPVTAVSAVTIDSDNAADVTFSGAENPLVMDFTFGSARFSEPEKESRNGTSFVQQIEFFIPGDNETLLASINALLNKRFFAEADYYDDVPPMRLCGNTDKNERGVFIGMVLKKDFDSGKKIADLKGWKFLLTCESRVRAYWLSAALDS